MCVRKLTILSATLVSALCLQGSVSIRAGTTTTVTTTEVQSSMEDQSSTKLEASIVSYKYGVSYLSKLSESDKETVQFLVAKGILNFEDQSEMINLYGPLTNELAYKLLYRVANEDSMDVF